jgi:hypothetical protein
MSKPKLPTTAAGWVALAVGVAIVGLGTWQASDGNWLAAAIAALGALGTAINRGVIGSASKAGGAALVIVGLGMVASACAPGTYQQGLQYTAYLAAARDAGAAELLTRATATHKRCLAQHRANGAAYEACSRQEYQAVAGWLAAGRILCRTDGPLQGLLVEMRAAGAGK